MTQQDEKKQAIEAAVFRHLINHLRDKTEVQNIDLMNLADFCRNCLAKWYVSAAKEEGIEIDYEDARKTIYGMPYAEWKEHYQKPLTEEQKRAMNTKNP